MNKNHCAAAIFYAKKQNAGSEKSANKIFKFIGLLKYALNQPIE